METSDLSLFINRMVPSYILEEYASAPGQPSFEKFLTYFFEFLGKAEVKDGILTVNPLNAISNLLRYRDIDETETEFLGFFKNKYAHQYPYIGTYDVREQTTSMDIRNLIKKIREFYVSKGTVDSIQFFFRSVFDKEVELYYPKEDMLRISDGRWNQPYYLGMVNLDGSALNLAQVQDLPDRYVYGQTSGAKGYIEAIPLEAVVNAAKDLAPRVWAGISSKDGNFRDGELVDLIDAVTNEVVVTYKLRDRGYGDLRTEYDPEFPLEQVYPAGPYRYHGIWKNAIEYKIGDVIYDTPNDRFLVAQREHTSISLPEWVVAGRYRRASLVSFGGSVYKVKDNRPDYKNSIVPRLDPKNWTFLDVTTAESTIPVWDAAETYTNNDEVKVLGDGIWRRYRLNMFRKEFTLDVSPDLDTLNWELVADIDTADVSAWSAEGAYYQADEVVKDKIVFRSRWLRENYSSVESPLDDPNWDYVSDTTEADPIQEWQALQVYNGNDQVKIPFGTSGVWRIYRLLPILPEQFLSTIQPVLEQSRWELLTGAENFVFADEVDQAGKWLELPVEVDPERVGAGDDFPGRWIGRYGFLSSDKKIQDSFFYQDYSYQVKVDLDRTVFMRPLIENVHPAGFQIFNIVENVELLAPFDMGVVLNPGIRFNIEWPRATPENFYEPSTDEGFDFNLVPFVVFSTSSQIDYSEFEADPEDHLMSEFEDLTFESFEINAGTNHMWMFREGLKLNSVPPEILRQP